MGLDLYCLPFDGDIPPDPATGGKGLYFSHTVLHYIGAHCVRERLDHADTNPIPAGFTGFVGKGRGGEFAYGKLTTDPYGAPIQCVAARALARAMAPDAGADIPGSHRPAVRAYLAALPANTRVALYWH